MYINLRIILKDSKFKSDLAYKDICHKHTHSERWRLVLCVLMCVQFRVVYQHYWSTTLYGLWSDGIIILNALIFCHACNVRVREREEIQSSFAERKGWIQSYRYIHIAISYLVLVILIIHWTYNLKGVVHSYDPPVASPPLY